MYRIRESNNLQRSLQRVQAATILQWAAVATDEVSSRLGVLQVFFARLRAQLVSFYC
jgi:hypothetical protein